MTPLAFPPMPVVLSTTPASTTLKGTVLVSTGGFCGSAARMSREEAAEQYGVGSELHRIASHFDPPPPPTPEEQAELDRVRAAALERNDRWRESWTIPAAFGAVGECIALVEAHATVLKETDASSLLTLDEWRSRAFDALALLYERSPERLPIGPDVHADCRGDDR